LKNHLPEKDGIIAGLLVAEILAVNNKSLSEKIEQLYVHYGRRVERQVSLPLTSENERKLRDLIKTPPEKMGNRSVINTETIDGIKLDFSDDDWILFRFSGTEPLIRCYAEAGSKKELDGLMTLALEWVS
jgi:phosphoglucomutase